jgi:hypothetical protein
MKGISMPIATYTPNPHTAALLLKVILPESVAHALVNSHFGRIYSSALVNNISVGDAAAELFSYNLASNDLERLIHCSESYAVIDKVLASKEKRHGAINAIVRRWDLSSADQLRLASRSMSPRTAEYLLRESGIDDWAKAKVMLRADGDSAGAWLVHNNLPDDTIYDLTVSYLSKKNRRLHTLPLVLLRRPALRERFAFSSVSQMMEAAAWFSLSKKAQETIFEATLDPLQDLASRTHFALLLQPTLNPTIRTRIWEDISAVLSSGYYSSNLRHVYAYGLPDPTNTVWSCGPVAKVSDSGMIDTLLDLLGPLRGDDRDQNLTTYRLGLYSELARSHHLTNTQRERLLMMVCSDNSAGKTHHIVVADLANRIMKAMKLEPDQVQSVRLRCGYTPYKELRPGDFGTPEHKKNTLSVRPATARATAGSSMPKLGPVSRPSHSPAFKVGDATRSYVIPEDLSAYLVSQLGDGESATSLNAWMLFWDMADAHPDSTISYLTSVCSKLATATTHTTQEIPANSEVLVS